MAKKQAKAKAKTTAQATNKPPIKEKYVQPDELWKHFEGYVEHERSNPLFKVEYVGRDGEKVSTPLQVPITFEGFENYLQDKGIIADLGSYASNRDGRYIAYIPIIRRIRSNCFVQNFKGAAVGLFGATIISQKLGLVQKIDNNISGSLNTGPQSKEKRKATRDKYENEV